MNPHDEQIHFWAVSVVMGSEGTRRQSPYSAAVRSRIGSLELLVFVVGSSTLGVEIAAARLMAPFFGDSTIVWANTIAIVLVALSVGYWFGGRMADRHPHLRGLSLLVLGAAVLLALRPIGGDPLPLLRGDAFRR